MHAVARQKGLWGCHHRPLGVPGVSSRSHTHLDHIIRAWSWRQNTASQHRTQRDRAAPPRALPQDSVEGSNADGTTPTSNLSTNSPNFSDGINWYCYTVMGFLFLTDFTPIAGVLKASGLLAVTIFQWAIFFVPAVAWFHQQRWKMGPLLLGPKQPAPAAVAMSAVFGAALFVAVSTLLRAKAGMDPSVLQQLSMPSLEGVAIEQATTQTAISALTQRPQSLGDLLQLIGLAGISPAVCEEMLFRGFLLQALQTAEGPGKPSLGRIDAVFLAGALFAAAHLDIPNFFSLSVLGITCGGVAIATGSVLPAMTLHAAFNTTALIMGLPSA